MPPPYTPNTPENPCDVVCGSGEAFWCPAFHGDFRVPKYVICPHGDKVFVGTESILVPSPNDPRIPAHMWRCFYDGQRWKQENEHLMEAGNATRRVRKHRDPKRGPQESLSRDRPHD